MKQILYVSLVLILLFGLAACSPPSTQEPQIAVEEPWVRAAAAMEDAGRGEMEGGIHMGGATSAAYMTLRNTGQQADRLIEVRSNIAEVVETHLTETVDGVASMSRVDGIEVPASGSVNLEPGGLHIMFINLNQDLNAGDMVRLTLVFEKSGEIDVSAPVRAP